MDISLFRGCFTRLNKRLRQEAQNHPETWSQMLVLSAIDQMDGMARFLAGVSAGLLWALPAGYAARMVPKHQKGREIAIAMVGIPLALPHGVRVGTFLGNPGHFRVWVKSVTWWGILRNAFRWMPPELRRHKRPQ